jgi:predicted DNA-binding protein
MPASTTIRVTPETRDRLNRISAERGISAGEVVDELVSTAEDRALIEAMERHYKELRDNPEAWAEFKAEGAAWDATAGDGLVPFE